MNVDTLHINLKSPSPQSLLDLYAILPSGGDEKYYVDANISLARNTKITCNRYRGTVDIYFKDRLFGYFHLIPLASWQQINLVPFSIYCNRLYESGWTGILKEILSVLNLGCWSVSKLHIALDCQGIAEQFLKLYYCDDYQLKSRLKLRGTHDGKTKEVLAKFGFKLGSERSDFHITFYPKVKEYIKKPFIEEYHRKNGVTGSNVERMEIRLKNSEICQYDVDVFKLESTEVLVGIFEAFSSKKVGFIDKTKVSYRNRNKIFESVEWLSFPAWAKIKSLTLLKNSTGFGSPTVSRKITIRQAFLEYLRYPQDSTKKFLRDYCTRSNLREWFNRASPSWVQGDLSKVAHLIRFVNDDRSSTERAWFFLKTISWSSIGWIAAMAV